MEIGIVRPVKIEDEMQNSYLDYAMSVIVSRALPDVRDGLKPSQRRILVAMHDLNLAPNRAHRKCAKIAGDTSGNYHPHGEAVIYPTLVRMAQEFNMRYPLGDGQGNFGSVDNDPPAAMRYTEARLTPIALEMLADIDMETVDWLGNYDNTRQEPTVLPGRFPNLICNGSAGIAVGMATSIPPHNLTEVVNALLHLIERPDATVDDLCKFIPGPDFPTGGIILGDEDVRKAYATGHGRVVVRARVSIEEPRSGRFQLVVTELPYQTNKATLQERIAELVRERRIDGISDMRDESDRQGMRLVIEVKRDAKPQTVLAQLYKHTALQQAYGINMLAIVETLVTISSRGYVKRLPPDTYRAQRRGGRGIRGMMLRDEDAPRHMVVAKAHDDILFFTDRGRVFRLKAHQIPEADRTAKGTPIIN